MASYQIPAGFNMAVNDSNITDECRHRINSLCMICTQMFVNI